MKRLYDSSLGPLELELDTQIAVLSIWRFDAEGRVAAESGDEWDHTDVADLLQVEIGLPEEEARSIAERFLEAAKAEGHEQPPASSQVGLVVGLSIVTGIVVLLGIGAWTVASWIL